MNSSKSAFIATVIVALLAVAAAVFAFWYMRQGSEVQDPYANGAPYRPTRETQEKMLDAAGVLISDNFTIVRLYITRGVDVRKEPYANTDKPLGNTPEDGLFSADSELYQTLEDIESIVDRTFIAEEADRIKNNRLNNGNTYYFHAGNDFGRVYDDKNGRLGVNAAFAEFMFRAHSPDFPETWEYHIDWSGISFDIEPLSDYECRVLVKLEVDGQERILERRMSNYDEEGWRLDKLVHE